MMRPRNLFFLLVITLCFVLTACNAPSLTPTESGAEPEDPQPTEADLEFDLSEYAGLGIEWDEEFEGGGINFTGSMGTCTHPEEWQIFLAITETFEPGRFLLISGQTTVVIPQVGDGRLSGDFEVGMYGTLTDPNCSITYDLVMDMSVEITPSSLRVLDAVVGSQDVQVSCSDPAADPPLLEFPTSFVVAPMSGAYECFEP